MVDAMYRKRIKVHVIYTALVIITAWQIFSVEFRANCTFLGAKPFLDLFYPTAHNN